MKPLNSRDVKHLRQEVERLYGFFPEGEYVFFETQKQRVFLVNRDIEKVPFQTMRVERMGLYFADRSFTPVRLSKTGAQFLACEAEKKGITLKNIVPLSKDEVKEYFTGLDLKKDLPEGTEMVLVSYEGTIFGCSRYKEGKILNSLPKAHRTHALII